MTSITALPVLYTMSFTLLAVPRIVHGSFCYVRMPILDFYTHLTHHIVPGPQSGSYFLPLLLLPVALLVPRTRLSRWQSIAIFHPIMALASAHAWWRMGGVDVISVNALLSALLLLVFKDPWTDFKHVTHQATSKGEKSTHATTGQRKETTDASAKGSGVEAPALLSGNYDIRGNGQSYPTSLSQRLLWVGTLLASIRLNNWKIGSPSHDKGQPPKPAFRSRTSFVAQALISFIRGYLILDLTRAYISYDPYFTDLSIPISSSLPFSHFPWGHVPPQLLRTMIIGAQAWALISQMFYVPCLLPIGLHALGLIPDEWSPHTWAFYYGPPSVIFSHGVRGFWGQYWHQTMRYTSSGPGYAIADALRLTQGSPLRYGTITTVAFGLSGIVHMGLVPPEPLHATVNANTIRLCIARFFWVQPIAMVLELAALRLWKGMHGSDSRPDVRLRLLTGAWVICWFAICLPLLGEAGRQLGYWRVWPIPVSLIRGMSGEGWIVWPFLSR